MRDAHASDLERQLAAAHVAAQYGHTGILYHFKTRWDAHLDALDLDGRSPLHWAAYKGFPDAVKLLLFCDADVARQDKEGCSPLHWAAIRGKSEAAHVPAQAGGLALMEATDSEGSTAAQLATDKGHKSLGGFLAHHQERLQGETRNRKSPGAFLNDKGMAVACLALILGLVFMFVHTVVLADGMPNMDVHLAAWSWLVVLSSGAGLFLMYRVSVADPGFVDAAHAAEVIGSRGGAKARNEPSNGAAHRRGASLAEAADAAMAMNAMSFANLMDAYAPTARDGSLKKEEEKTPALDPNKPISLDFLTNPNKE